MKKSIMKKSIVYLNVGLALSAGSVRPSDKDLYTHKHRHHFRGGSRGKGGKIKYKRS